MTVKTTSNESPASIGPMLVIRLAAVLLVFQAALPVGADPVPTKFWTVTAETPTN